jgi:hypothetical protein
LVFDTFHNRLYIKLLCFFAVFTIFSSVITNPMNVSGQTDNFQPYSYNDLGISLKKPSDWAFASLKNGLQLIKEKDLVYLEIRKSNPQPSNTTLEQLAINSIQERFSSRKDFQLLNLSQTLISGNLPAYKAVYEFLKTQNQKDFTNEGTSNKVLRITTFAHGNAYIVKYVSEKNKYDSYLPIAEKIIHSLIFNVQEKSPKGYVQCLDRISSMFLTTTLRFFIVPALIFFSFSYCSFR